MIFAKVYFLVSSRVHKLKQKVCCKLWRKWLECINLERDLAYQLLSNDYMSQYCFYFFIVLNLYHLYIVYQVS